MKTPAKPTRLAAATHVIYPRSGRVTGAAIGQDF